MILWLVRWQSSVRLRDSVSFANLVDPKIMMHPCWHCDLDLKSLTTTVVDFNHIQYLTQLMQFQTGSSKEQSRFKHDCYSFKSKMMTCHYWVLEASLDLQMAFPSQCPGAWWLSGLHCDFAVNVLD